MPSVPVLLQCPVSWCSSWQLGRHLCVCACSLQELLIQIIMLQCMSCCILGQSKYYYCISESPSSITGIILHCSPSQFMKSFSFSGRFRCVKFRQFPSHLHHNSVFASPHPSSLHQKLKTCSKISYHSHSKHTEMY